MSAVLATMPARFRHLFVCLAAMLAMSVGTKAMAEVQKAAIPLFVTGAEQFRSIEDMDFEGAWAVQYRTVSVSGRSMLVRARLSERRRDTMLLDAEPVLGALEGRTEIQGNMLAFHDYSAGTVRTVDFLTGLVRESGTIIGKDEALERAGTASFWLSGKGLQLVAGTDPSGLQAPHPGEGPSAPAIGAARSPQPVLLQLASLPVSAPGRSVSPSLPAADLDMAIAGLALTQAARGETRAAFEGVFDQRVVRPSAVTANLPRSSGPEVSDAAAKAEKRGMGQSQTPLLASAQPAKPEVLPVGAALSSSPVRDAVARMKAPSLLQAVAVSSPASAAVEPAMVSLSVDRLVTGPAPGWKGELHGVVAIDGDGNGSAGQGDEYIEGQMVQLTHVESGETRRHRSAAFGQFGFSGLEPGRYRLSIMFGRQPVVLDVDLNGPGAERRHDILVADEVFSGGDAAAAVTMVTAARHERKKPDRPAGLSWTGEAKT